MPQNTFKCLAYLGLLPFLACSVLITMDISNLPYLGSIQNIQAVYALAIACFMSGIHWGQALSNQSLNKLYLISNIHTVLLFFAFIVCSRNIFLLCSSGIFLSILMVDYNLLRKQIITNDYFKLRAIVTFIVILSIIVSLI